jgi:hypothetical protein
MSTEPNKFQVDRGVAIFAKAFMGIPAQQAAKATWTANACVCPSRPASFAGHPTRGAQHHSRNDSTRFRKACIFTTQKALRENTCTIASGDYSTPVSQRVLTANDFEVMIEDKEF